VFGDVVTTINKMEQSAVAHVPVSLATYQLLVDRCAREKLNLVIANGSALHARILIDKLFEVARSNVSLISGVLRQQNKDGVQIYSHDNVIARAKKFLASPQSTLDVVLQKGSLDGGSENKFFNEIVNDPTRRGTVSIYYPKEGVLSAHETPHFMVSDRSAYRFETGKDADPTNESVTAIANFGDLATAGMLSEIFDDVVSLLTADANMRDVSVFAPGKSFSA
jgi:hypothetical protein